jgi:hypothetical protein
MRRLIQSRCQLPQTQIVKEPTARQDPKHPYPDAKDRRASPSHGRGPNSPSLGKANVNTIAPPKSALNLALGHFPQLLSPLRFYSAGVAAITRHSEEGSLRRRVRIYLRPQLVSKGVAMFFAVLLPRGQFGCPIAGRILQKQIMRRRAVRPNFPSTRSLEIGRNIFRLLPRL